MDTPDDPDLAALSVVTAQLRAAVQRIEDDQWGLPTPCTDWDLSALIDHVTGGNWFTGRILDGETAEQALAATMSRFGGDSATIEDVVRSADDLTEAFKPAGVLDRSWHHVAGTLSGREILRLRVHDLIVHVWDIGETLAPPGSVPPNLIQWGLEDLLNGQSSTTTHFGIVELPATPSPADAESAYLRAFGR